MVKKGQKKEKGFTPAKYKQSLSSTGSRNFTGFTLIELVIVIGIIMMLSIFIIMAINPPRQLRTARDNQRKTHISAIYGAIMDYVGKNEGEFPDCVTELEVDANECAVDLVPDYLKEIPQDPNENCSYFVKKAVTERVGVKTECAEESEEIFVGDWIE